MQWHVAARACILEALALAPVGNLQYLNTLDVLHVLCMCLCEFLDAGTSEQRQ
jgi:hypothetical protein